MIAKANIKHCVLNHQKTKRFRGACSFAGLYMIVGAVMGFAFSASSWIVGIVVFVCLAGVTLGIVAICKMPLKGKTGTLVSIFILLICTGFAVETLFKSQHKRLTKELFRAAKDGDESRIKVLMAKGFDINKKSKSEKYTLLHSAVRSGNNKMLNALLRCGADVNIRNFNQLTPLGFLLKESINPPRNKDFDFDYEQGARLLIAHGSVFDFEHKYSRGVNCIQRAISAKQNEILQVMMENGADINFKEKKGGYLHYAVRQKAKIDIIETLLSAGIDIGIRDENGNTALHIAAYSGQGDIVEELLKRGVSIDSKNKKQMTALDMAKDSRGSFLGNRQEVIELLEKRSDF